MRKLILSLSLVSMMVVPFSAQAGETGWLTESKLKGAARKLNRQNIKPTGMSCRADPSKRVFKPQLKLTWTANSKGRNWYASVYKSQVNWKPSNKSTKVKYEKTLVAGAGGTKYKCTLYYTKEDQKSNFSSFKY